MGQDPRPPADPNARFLTAVLSFGLVLPTWIAAGAGLGWLADRFLGTFPAMTLLLGGLGVAGGLREVYREASKFFESKGKP